MPETSQFSNKFVNCDSISQQSQTLLFNILIFCSQTVTVLMSIAVFKILSWSFIAAKMSETILSRLRMSIAIV